MTYDWIHSFPNQILGSEMTFTLSILYFPRHKIVQKSGLAMFPEVICQGFQKGWGYLEVYFEIKSFFKNAIALQTTLFWAGMLIPQKFFRKQRKSTLIYDTHLFMLVVITGSWLYMIHPALCLALFILCILDFYFLLICFWI